MSELEEKLGTILSNPQIMQQIMSMAQAIGSQSPQKASEAPTPKKEPVQAVPLPNIDPKLLENIAGIARQGNIDQNQVTLLQALSPYLSPGKLHKLERAMHAARLAGAASSFLNAGGLQFLFGR